MSGGNVHTIYYNSPLGWLEISGNHDGIKSILFVDAPNEDSKDAANCLHEAKSQLEEYFNKTRKSFNMKLNFEGTEFQIKVWQTLLEIPFGKTTTYKTQAEQLGDLKAIRAMASANGRNPISIVVPCHRVIGSDGSLTGYAGGLWRKKWLLEHEQSIEQLRLF